MLFSYKVSFSQTKIDLGELPNIDSVSCAFQTHRPDKDIVPIRESKNSLEIRVHVTTGFSPPYILILSFDKINWLLVKATPSYDSLSKTIGDTLKNIPQNILEQNFDSLKKNKIFSLPDFYCLNLKGSVDDGIWGCIEIKAGDFYRQYDYNNPCSYLEMNKDVAELKYLCNVIDLFEKMIYSDNPPKVRKGKQKHT